MADNKQIAQDVLEAIGGAQNVSSATNCMTRLRLTIKDKSIPQVDEVKKITGVIGCQWSGEQFQVIIGQNAGKVLAEFVALSGVEQGAPVKENLDPDLPKEKLTPKLVFDRILDYMSGSMVQIIPITICAGLLRTIATIIGPQMLGLVTTDSTVYQFLYQWLYDAGFYFLPIVLGYAAAKKLGASPVLGMFLGGVLISPGFVAAVADGAPVTLFGLPLPMVNYASSVLPIMLSAVWMYLVEKFMKKHIPEVLSFIFTPLCTMIATIPVALFILAPIGSELGNIIGNAIFALSHYGPVIQLIGMVVIGALWQLLVVTGMHVVLIQLALVVLLQNGSDPFVFVSTNAALWAVYGMILGSALRIRNKEEKALCWGYLASAMLGGVTEPGLFGIALRFRRPVVGMIAGGAAGALVAGLWGVAIYPGGGASNVLSVLGYVQGGTWNLTGTIVYFAVSMAVAAVVTYLFGYDKKLLDEIDAKAI